MGKIVVLTDYEYNVCRMFADEAAKTHQAIEFGQKSTSARSITEIARDIMIGKMAEFAVVKTLYEDFGLRLPVNVQIYSKDDCDDNDVVINGWVADIKSTRSGRYMLFNCSKINYRFRTGTMPDVIIQCKTPWDYETDNPKDRSVELVGCVSAKRMASPENRLRKGECIPGTAVHLQADNFGVRFDRLSDFSKAVDYMRRNRKI